MRGVGTLGAGAGDKVFIRCDFNVPIVNGHISDDTRIREAIPTIKYFVDRGCRVVLSSHLGRPEGTRKTEFSLLPVARKIEEILKLPIYFVDYYGDVPQVQLPPEAKLIMLENLRFYPGEESGDVNFVMKLMEFTHYYVNEAFASSHRKHASVYHLPLRLPLNRKCAGLLFDKEVAALKSVLVEPKRPLVAVIGGAKVSTKLKVIINLLRIADYVLIGGAMAFTFLKSMGRKVGNSLVEDNLIKDCKEILDMAKSQNKNIILPEDFVCCKTPQDNNLMVCSGDIPDGYAGYDIGPLTLKKYSDVILGAGTIIWNGPPGMFEVDNFAKGTLFLGKMIEEATQRGAFTVAGGGDTLAAINKLQLKDISYVSTAGGAMLEFLEGKVLPGIEALEKELTPA